MQNANSELSKRVTEASKFPRKEFQDLKKERITLHKQLLVFDKDKRTLSNLNSVLKRKLNAFEDEKKQKSEVSE